MLHDTACGGGSMTTALLASRGAKAPLAVGRQQVHCFHVAFFALNGRGMSSSRAQNINDIVGRGTPGVQAPPEVLVSAERFCEGRKLKQLSVPCETPV